jgi:hypothetical protein
MAGELIGANLCMDDQYRAVRHVAEEILSEKDPAWQRSWLELNPEYKWEARHPFESQVEQE